MTGSTLVLDVRVGTGAYGLEGGRFDHDEHPEFVDDKVVLRSLESYTSALIWSLASPAGCTY